MWHNVLLMLWCQCCIGISCLLLFMFSSVSSIWFVATVELILFPLHVCFLWRIFRHITSAIARLYSHAPTFNEYLTKGCYYWVHQRVTSILWRMLKNSQVVDAWNPPLLYSNLVWHTFVFFNKNMAIITCMIGGTKYICLWFCERNLFVFVKVSVLNT